MLRTGGSDGGAGESGTEDVTSVACQQWDEIHNKLREQIDDMEDKIDKANAGRNF